MSRPAPAGPSAPRRPALLAGRLLDLPGFLLGNEGPGDPVAWDAGLRLTGHFLERDAFGARHRAVPEARHRLADRVAALAAAV